MRRFLKILAVILVLALGWFVIQGVYVLYPSWILSVYLILFVFAPLLNISRNIGGGQAAYKSALRTMAIVSVGLLITTVFFKYVLQVWIWACLLGALLPLIFLVIFQRRVVSATLAVNEAAALINNGSYDRALQQIEPARKTLIGRNNRDGIALADFNMGVAYHRKRDTLRAVRYYNSALSLYRALGNAEMISKVEEFLAELERQGVNITMPAANEEKKTPYIEAGFILSGAILSASLMSVWYFWANGNWKAEWPVLLCASALLLLFLAGNYMAGSKALWRSEEGRKGGASRIFFNLFFLLFIPSIAGWALSLGFAEPNLFPANVQIILTALTGFTASLPAFVLWAAPIFCMIVMIACMLPPHPFQNILGGIGRAGTMEAQALTRARHYFEEHEWSRAIPQLSQIDLTRDRDAHSKTNILFALAFAYYMSNHKSESLQYLEELLEIDSNDAPALYLAGYINLADNKNDDAEDYLRKLVNVNPGFRPMGGGADTSAQYYLGLCLYRKALNMMGSNVEESSRLLSEISRLGALDRYVADALMRVHLYRFVQMLRLHQLQDAANELKLAQEKLTQLEGLQDNREEIAKLHGLCQAAQALLAYRQENYRVAADGFGDARTTVKDISSEIPDFLGGDSLFADFLRSVLKRSAQDGRLHVNFNRDLAFLTGLAYLRTLADNRGKTKKSDWKSTIALAEKNLEESVSLAPEFIEGKAMLGIVYYYFSEDDKKRERGIELLEGVSERSGARFIIKTLADHKTDKKRHEDAQNAYFELLQQYLQFASVPLKQREELRERFIEKMKQTGKYEMFKGRGGLEIDDEREHQPSVQEYLRRSELLQEKIRQLCELDKDGRLPEKVQKKIQDIGAQKDALKENVSIIAKLERELLAEAQEYI